MMETNHSVLCVDDEKNILSSLKRLLRKEPYQLLTTSNPHEALELLEAHDVQIIMSDQRMPEISGTELLAKVKEKYPDILRIILSGYTDVNTITESINKGNIYRFFLKPWNDTDLKLEIRSALEQFDEMASINALHRQVMKKNKSLMELNQKLGTMLREKTHSLNTKYKTLELSHVILEDIPLPVISVNSDAEIVFINRNTDIFVNGSNKITIGKKLSHYFNNDICAFVSECLGEQEKQQARQYRIKDKTFDVVVMPLNGKFAGAGATMTFYGV